jgi:hypothetical protein
MFIGSAGDAGTAGGIQMLQIVNERVGRFMRETVTCSMILMLNETEKIQSTSKRAVPPLAVTVEAVIKVGHMTAED